jgi:uncharacterized protein (TIGR02246 family)
MAAPTPEALPAAFAAALERGDVQGALELWAEDAVILQPDGAALRGRDAIEQLLRSAVEHGVAFEISVSDIYVAGEVAIARGTLTTRANGPGGEPFEHSSNPVAIYSHTADGWRVAIDAPWGLPRSEP